MSTLAKCTSPTVRDLKASFEARDNPNAISLPPTIRLVLPANANMFNKKFSNPLKSSIDTVLDTAKPTLQKPNVTVTAPDPALPTPANPTTTPPALPTPNTTATASTIPTAAPKPVRPSATPRPSWIGPPRPDRPVTPGLTTMKQPVTVEYTSPGLQPPVYVFTSLSNPQWDAVEMDSQKNDAGEYHFTKSFAAEEGEYQYKFRLGPGDWWALNESAPVVDDGAGNKNNLMVVKAQVPAQASQPPPEKPMAVQLPTGPAQPEAVATPAPAPLMQHEALTQPTQDASKAQPPQSISMPAAPTLNQPLPTSGAGTPAPAPLMKHETFFPAPVEVKDEKDVEPDYAYNGNDEDQDEEDDEDDDGPPLLRHESFAPDSEEQTQAPLLRHESMAIGEHLDDDRGCMSPQMSASGSVYSSGEDSVAPEADPNDPSLEHFPTDQNGIFEHIHRASSQLALNEGRDDVDYMNAVRSTSSEHPTSPLHSLPSVQEDDEEEDEEELDELRSYEREKAQKVWSQDVDKVDPAAPITPPMTPQEVEKTMEKVLEEAHVATDAVLEAEQAEARTQESPDEEKVIEFVQERSAAGTFVDFLTRPAAWLAFAVVAVAVGTGFWKLR